MSLLIIILALWGIGKAISAAQERKKQEQIARIKREQQRQREEAARMREDFRREQAEARERAKRQAEIERETVRLAREQERQERAQAAAWEKQRKEDAKRDAQLAKHEEQIRKMQFQLEQATADIDHLTNTLSELYAMLDYLKMEQSGTTPGGKEYAKYQTKIISLENRVHATETRLAKAQHAKAEAERKLA